MASQPLPYHENPSNGFFFLSSFGKENNPKWTHRITLAYTPTSTKEYFYVWKNVLTKLAMGVDYNIISIPTSFNTLEGCISIACLVLLIISLHVSGK
jgi:hypothetical protein